LKKSVFEDVAPCRLHNQVLMMEIESICETLVDFYGITRGNNSENSRQCNAVHNKSDAFAIGTKKHQTKQTVQCVRN
jgi:hypothetical protein